MLVARLPALDLGSLAGALLAVDLEQLVGDLELLTLESELLTLNLEGLILEVRQRWRRRIGSLGLAMPAAGFWPVGETSMR